MKSKEVKKEIENYVRGLEVVATENDCNNKYSYRYSVKFGEYTLNCDDIERTEYVEGPHNDEYDTNAKISFFDKEGKVIYIIKTFQYNFQSITEVYEDGITYEYNIDHQLICFEEKGMVRDSRDYNHNTRLIEYSAEYREKYGKKESKIMIETNGNIIRWYSDGTRRVEKLCERF